MDVLNTLKYENDVLRGYITWSGILLIKLLLMAFLTGFNRFRKGAYENPEDIRGRENVEIKKDEDVERVRRAHLNDLENIPAFLFAGLAYVFSNPNVDLALWLFRIGVLARIGHTIVYAIYPVRQPARFITFIITLLITLFMIIASIAAFFHL
ncbi:hypothetical protein PVAND_011978 [Polypedilum vanderplanki]|uniref:Microsomal glutathione S-transferase 1 n=1 Tax=Polypedilum vanderplanki TaxID=319348 RepID=A0A9J6CLB2_POLVA|nr:hypothetical protein PVAND_011978 [Polypedilum vanderplanki]